MTNALWFIRLVKLKNPPNRQSMEHVNQQKAEAEKWGVKVHHTFFTLGKYDLVAILEAPDEKTALRYSIMLADNATSDTLVAVSREEVDGWMK